MFTRIQDVVPGATQGYTAKSALFSAGVADRGTLFDSTGSFTITIDTTGMTAGWSAWFRCVSGTQTLDPSGATLINGASTYAVSNAGDVVLVEYTGSAFLVVHTQRPATVAITGGTINGTPIGGTTPAAGAFTTGSFTDAVTLTTASSGLTIGITTGTSLIVSSTAASTTTATGCATFAGGIGVAGAAFIGTSSVSVGVTSTGGTTGGTFISSDAGTANTTSTVIARHITSSTAAANFGVAFAAEGSTTTATREMGQFQFLWADATDATRAAKFTIYVRDSGGARTLMNGEASGTAPKLAFFGATSIVKPGATTDLRTALINLGLYTTGGATPLDLNGGAFTCGGITLADATNIAVNTSTGTKIGTATGQKIGFWNVTPVIQPASANQAAITDSTGGTASTTLAAITAGAAYAQSDMTAVKNALASLARLQDAMRTALVNTGIMKGAA
jgi:hypothetical protein